jgi:hypothetical protein
MPARRSSSEPASAWRLLLPGLLAAAVAHGAPAVGRYEGRLCVATTGTPECGPASVELRSAGQQAIVRVSDMRYSLALHGSRVNVVLKHGAMQIDGFTGAYEWKGSALHFVDADKGVRYEVQLGERRREPR